MKDIALESEYKIQNWKYFWPDLYTVKEMIYILTEENVVKV